MKTITITRKRRQREKHHPPQRKKGVIAVLQNHLRVQEVIHHPMGVGLKIFIK